MKRLNQVFFIYFPDKPRISVQLPEGGNVVRKEVSFTLTCNIDSNPLHDTITWYRDTRIIQGATSDTYTEAGGLREDTEYKCVVGNRLGSSEASTNLLVQCKLIVCKICKNGGNSKFVWQLPGRVGYTSSHPPLSQIMPDISHLADLDCIQHNPTLYLDVTLVFVFDSLAT